MSAYSFAYDETDGGSRCTRCDKHFTASIPFPPQRKPQQPANGHSEQSHSEAAAS